MERNDDIDVDVDNRQINSKLNWLAISLFCLLASSACGSATSLRSHRIHFHSRSLHKTNVASNEWQKTGEKQIDCAMRTTRYLVPAKNLHTHSVSTVRWASNTMTMTCIIVKHYGIARAPWRIRINQFMKCVSSSRTQNRHDFPLDMQWAGAPPPALRRSREV